MKINFDIFIRNSEIFLDAKKNIRIFKKLINSIVEANAFFIAFIVVHSYVHRYSQGKSV